MESYDHIITYEQYEKDYTNALRVYFESHEKTLVEKYIEDVRTSGEIEEVYQERVAGFESGQYDRLYVDAEIMLHSLCFPNW